jgi:hypothetical protein
MTLQKGFKKRKRNASSFFVPNNIKKIQKIPKINIGSIFMIINNHKEENML